jgi:hypothetical protein
MKKKPDRHELIARVVLCWGFFGVALWFSIPYRGVGFWGSGLGMIAAASFCGGLYYLVAAFSAGSGRRPSPAESSASPPRGVAEALPPAPAAPGRGGGIG